MIGVTKGDTIRVWTILHMNDAYTQETSNSTTPNQDSCIVRMLLRLPGAHLIKTTKQTVVFIFLPFSLYNLTLNYTHKPTSRLFLHSTSRALEIRDDNSTCPMQWEFLAMGEPWELGICQYF